MFIEEETSQGIIYVDFSSVTGAELNLSGGLDSAILLYTMCESMTKQNSYFPIHCLTAANTGDIFGVYHAGLVFNFVKRKFPTVELYHQVDYSMLAGANKIRKKEIAIAKLYKEGKININIDAVTRNPLSDDFVYIAPTTIHHTRPVEFRNDPIAPIKKFKKYDTIFTLYRPWHAVDKRALAEIAKRKNIMHKLLFITRSCTDTRIHTCGKCWWCQERAWAFPEERAGQIQTRLDPRWVK